MKIFVGFLIPFLTIAVVAVIISLWPTWKEREKERKKGEKEKTAPSTSTRVLRGLATIGGTLGVWFLIQWFINSWLINQKGLGSIEAGVILAFLAPFIVFGLCKLAEMVGGKDFINRKAAVSATIALSFCWIFIQGYAHFAHPSPTKKVEQNKTLKKLSDFVNREPKQKFILQGVHEKGRVPIVVLENGRRRGHPRIRLVVYDYLGRSTWYLSHKWEPVGTITLNPVGGNKDYNYRGYWVDKNGSAPVWFKFNKEKTRAAGKVYLHKKWSNCWLKL